MTSLQRAARDVDERRDDHPALALFAVMWALAAAWHLLGNTFVESSWSQAVLALAVGLVLWRPA